MLAIHLKCGRDDGVSLNGLVYDKTAGVFRSGNWDVREKDASALVGGWIYLHPTKPSRSEFGGIIVGFEAIVVPTLDHSDRVIFIIRRRSEGYGQKWRGKVHRMAHGSGIVDADLPHERELPVSERVPQDV